MLIALVSYQRPNFLKRAVASLQAQTCQDWRCILDDISEDPAVSEVINEIEDMRFTLRFRPLRYSGQAINNDILSSHHAGVIGWMCDNVEYHPTLIERVNAFFEANPTAFACYSTHERDIWSKDGLTRLGSASDFHHWDILPPQNGHALSGDLVGMLDYSQVFHRLPCKARWSENPPRREVDGLYFSELSRLHGPIYPLFPDDPLTFEHLADR